jgi:hypothetical protein
MWVCSSNADAYQDLLSHIRLVDMGQGRLAIILACFRARAATSADFADVMLDFIRDLVLSSSGTTPELLDLVTVTDTLTFCLELSGSTCAAVVRFVLWLIRDKPRGFKAEKVIEPFVSSSFLRLLLSAWNYDHHNYLGVSAFQYFDSQLANGQ